MNSYTDNPLLPPRPDGYTPEEWASYHRDPSSWCAAKLSDPNHDVRCTAADILRGLGPDAEGTIPAMIAALDHPDLDTRRAVAFAFIDIGDALKERAAAAIEPLRNLLSDPDNTMRCYAAAALGAIGPSATSCIPSLRRLLDDSDAEVRKYAAKALGEMRPFAADCIPSLRLLLDDPDEEVRHYAAEAIAILEVE